MQLTDTSDGQCASDIAKDAVLRSRFRWLAGSEATKSFGRGSKSTTKKCIHTNCSSSSRSGENMAEISTCSNTQNKLSTRPAKIEIANR